MNHRLHLRLEQLEQATNRLLATAEGMGEKVHVSPAAGQWSAAQVVQHLLVSESGIGQYIDKKLQQSEELDKAGFLTFLKSRLLRLVLRLPFTRIKAPAFLEKLVPATVAPLPELRTEWEAVRRRLERTLNEYPSGFMNRAIFKHPRSGMLTITQTLDFMVDHVLHHQKQVERISRQVATLPRPTTQPHP